MSEDNTFKKILTGNTWQENFNIWHFQDHTVEITQFANSKFVKSFEYSIDRALDGRFIIATPKAAFGQLLVTVNCQNPHPKLIFESNQLEKKYIELEAFQGFTDQKKNAIEQLIASIRTKFQEKQDELKKRNEHPQDSNLLKQDRIVRSIGLKIETLEIVVKSTIHLATNFQAYYENLRSDITKIENELEQIK
jgi:hypothetical protein